MLTRMERPIQGAYRLRIFRSVNRMTSTGSEFDEFKQEIYDCTKSYQNE